MTENLTATRVQAAMDALGIDQSELARRVRCSSAAINQIVMGHTRQSRFLPAIARELGVRLDYLSGDVDDPGATSVADSLTGEEREMIELLRALNSVDRKAVTQLVRSLNESRRAGGSTQASLSERRAET